MDYKTILENWHRFAQSIKPLTLNESREIMNEISAQTANKIYDWMRETDGLAYDFNEIFGENMRVTFPMDSADTRMLKAILRGVKAAGWLPPISDTMRERYRSIYNYEKTTETGQRRNPETDAMWEPTKEEWKAWEAGQIDAHGRQFPTKKVKQKRQRLAADGGGEYEVEIDVADLTMERRVEQVIPKGPRAGETITKVQKQGINKIIGGLEKKGEVPEGSAQWWAKNQTHYTKDNNHKKISQGLIEDKSQNMHVILSRHPIDVLRMSDISNIHSCHSEGSEYFHCAVQEAKGHGPIAYAVTEAELNKLLTPSEERERPIAKLDRMYDTMSQAERITQIRQDYDTGSPEGALVLLWVWARSNHGTKWWRDLDKRVEMAAKPEKFKEVALISKAKELNISPELFKQYIKNYDDAEARRNTGERGFKPYEGITSEEEYKAALEKHSKEATRAPDPRDIGDLDDEEIFRDNDRDVPGIGVKSRVRLRKYVDHPNELTFAAPESRTYGSGTPGFVGAVREFVWDKQKEIFAQELGDTDPETGKGEATTYFIPQLDYLTRYGGSYGDTRDGEILSMFFRPGRGEGLDDPFPFGVNVHHDSEGEEEDQYDQMAEEYNNAIDDLNDQANNELEHTSFGAHVNDDDWGQEPHVWADGTLTLTIPLGWGDDGEGNDVHATYDIPTGGADLRDFENRILDLPSEYPEEVYFEHTDEGALQITYNFNCEDCRTPDDADYFLDYMRELDGKYDRFYEIVRKKLVEEGYAKASAWDNTNSEIEDFEERLKNFNIIGDDDDDDPSGEIWFNLGVGHHNADPEVPLDINLPKQKLYWLTKHSNFNYASISRQLMHDNRFNDVIARGIAGRKDRNVVWVGPDTNSSFARFFAEKLKKLEAAANNYSEKQIDLPFGDKYARPAYEGVDFAKDVQIGLKFGLADQREAAEVPIYLRFRIIATSKDSKEELAGAFHFVEFVDEHMDMILQAAKEVTQEFVIEPNLEIAAELEKEYLSGNIAMELSEKVLSKFTYETRTPETMNHNKAIVEWWSSGNTWSDMSVYEKEVVVEKLLRGMSNGVYVQWDQQNHLPSAWERMVREWMTQAGVAGAIINKVDFRRHAKPEITDKFFGTKEERDEKRLEYELKLAKSRWRANHGEDPSEEEVAAWRKEIMNQLGMGDAAPLGTDARGSRDAGAAAAMGITPQEAENLRMRLAAIEELTIAFGGRKPTEEEIEDLLQRKRQRRGFDHTPRLERVAHLKKVLTEAKLRAKIRRIIKEAE